MKTIKLTAPDKTSTFELHIYKAGETATIFQGATGVFGKAAGSKTAGIVYVTKGGHGITAQDDHVDNGQVWDWIQQWMQKGMDSESDAALAAIDKLTCNVPLMAQDVQRHFERATPNVEAYRVQLNALILQIREIARNGKAPEVEQVRPERDHISEGEEATRPPYDC